MTVTPQQILDFRDWLAGLLIEHGGKVPHRGYATRDKTADLQVIAPDRTEIEIEIRIVERTP